MPDKLAPTMSRDIFMGPGVSPLSGPKAQAVSEQLRMPDAQLHQQPHEDNNFVSTFA